MYHATTVVRCCLLQLADGSTCVSVVSMPVEYMLTWFLFRYSDMYEVPYMEIALLAWEFIVLATSSCHIITQITRQYCGDA